jgi:hypothetical protein
METYCLPRHHWRSSGTVDGRESGYEENGLTEEYGVLLRREDRENC